MLRNPSIGQLMPYLAKLAAHCHRSGNSVTN